MSTEESIVNGGASQNILQKNFLFIVGSPRSGTTWLQLMLGAHPSVCASTELRLYDKYIAPWLDAWRSEALLAEEGKPYIGLPVLWQEAEFHDFLKGFLNRAYSKILATKPEATHLLDKHPGYSRFVDSIHFFIPQARFIHLIRDGRDVAVSLLAASKQLGWFGRQPLASYGKLWKDQVLAARKAAAFEGKYLEIRYESLSASPVSTLKTVFDFCGLSADDALIKSIVEQHQFETLKRSRSTPAEGVKVPEGHFREGKAGGWPQRFYPTDRYLFDQEAGQLLHELGYADKNWWAEGMHQKVWVPLAAIGPKTYRFCRRLGPAGAVLLGRRTAAKL